jgi:tetratricopeptide (TPR) repeat protein
MASNPLDSAEEQAAQLLQPFKLQLPEAPKSEDDPVKAWEQPVTIRTWKPAAPDPNPLFLEKRVYQGSNGRVYPLPVIDRIETEPQEQVWKAVHLENEYVRFMVLPEIGGRIHVGFDKTNGYDFFYRQNVIKPALVGLAGPWISGGVEFNWPQHHRPATFMPVECTIEREPDGSVTVWCSDHDPMTHMKGMHGLCLRPGKAFLELRARLYNGTTETQTFLWWANLATRVHEHYQSFFPRDLRYVADHAKRAVTEFPLSQGKYYGVDYGARPAHGIPDEQRPRHFVPDGSYPPNDLSWYANIPVPTSYMVPASNEDYFGGYDHARNAGVVHVADHHIAPGKKQWTWGNHDFGYAWDRHLTESDGPYIELMAGAYTDNQPDFSFLAPGETKTFSQFWYPIRDIGVPDCANTDAAVRVERNDSTLHVHLLVTSARPQSTLTVLIDGEGVARWSGDLVPETPLHQRFEARKGKLELVLEQSGPVLLRFAPEEIVPLPEPEVATEPALPTEVKTNDELFLVGQHLEQYRHPTRNPEEYWNEAIARDPRDSRANAALGRWRLRRGEFAPAESHLRTAIGRMTERNPNPSDGEPHYYLGITLGYLGRQEESYAAFYKATWNAGWRAPAYHRLAEIACVRHEWSIALDHIERSLRCDAENLNALNLKCIVLRKLGLARDAEAVLRATRALDPLDIVSRFLESGQLPDNGQQRLDLIFNFLRSGLAEEVLAVATPPEASSCDGAATMLLYARAHILARLGQPRESASAYKAAAKADSSYVFPSRIEEMILLRGAAETNPDDARAPYYLGNLLYDRRRHEEAIAMWERAVNLDPRFPTAWRNLGIAYYKVLDDPERALDAFARACGLAPDDARIFYEQDQLKKRTGETPQRRLAGLEANRALVERRDNLSVELATLYNNVGRAESALSILSGRQFQPWEGGEGMVLSQYIRANLLLGQKSLRSREAGQALRSFTAAANPPESLGEARHPLMNVSAIDYWLGVAYAESGSTAEAEHHWERAASAEGDFRDMKVQSISDMTYWSALALRRLGREQEAQALLRQIDEHATWLEAQTPRIDYFATSLPAMLLFEDDLKQRQTIDASFLKAQAKLGFGQKEEGLALLQDILRKDRSHPGAIDLMGWESR